MGAPGNRDGSSVFSVVYCVYASDKQIFNPPLCESHYRLASTLVSRCRPSSWLSSFASLHRPEGLLARHRINSWLGTRLNRAWDSVGQHARPARTFCSSSPLLRHRINSLACLVLCDSTGWPALSHLGADRPPGCRPSIRSPRPPFFFCPVVFNSGSTCLKVGTTDNRSQLVGNGCADCIENCKGGPFVPADI